MSTESVAPDVPVEVVPDVPEVVSDETPTETQDVAAPTPAPDETGETPVKELVGISKRFDELTRDINAERRARERAEWDAQHWREQAEANKPKPVETSSAVPKLEDFAFDEEKYRSAVIEFARAEAVRAAQDTLRKDREQQQMQSRTETFATRQNEYLAKNPEYRTKVMENSRLPISEGMRDLIVRSELGPQIAEYLADNLEQATQIYRMDPASMAMELGYIKAKLEKPPTAPVLVPKVSSAPPPPPQIEAKDAAPPKSIDDPNITDAEFARIRRRQIAQRR